jgi:hypothetical protein
MNISNGPRARFFIVIFNTNLRFSSFLTFDPDSHSRFSGQAGTGFFTLLSAGKLFYFLLFTL